jgi:hypothetical protein
LLEQAIVPPIPTLLERQQRRIPLLIHIEPRPQVLPPNARRLRQRRQKYFPRRRRIIFARSPSRPRPDSASATRSDSRSHSSPRSRSRARPSRPRDSAPPGHRSFDRLRNRSRRGRDWRRHHRLRHGRFYRRDYRRRHWKSRRVRAHSHEIHSLAPAPAPPSSPARRPRSSPAENVLAVKFRRRDQWAQKKKKDQRVHEE